MKIIRDKIDKPNCTGCGGRVGNHRYHWISKAKTERIAPDYRNYYEMIAHFVLY